MRTFVLKLLVVELFTFLRLVHGNKAANENPALLALQILWFRNHNYHANRLAQLYRTDVTNQTEFSSYWTDERLFLEARKWNIAEYQAVAVYDWLPAFVNASLPPYAGYSSTVNPGVAETFQLAAMRFGHSMVPSAMLRRELDQSCQFKSDTIRTCNAFHRANELIWSYDRPQPSSDTVAEFIVGMSSQFAEREDMSLTDDLRNFVFGPLNYNRRDLAALNIQRGRDHGVMDYNSVRQAYGLARKNSFDEITSDPEKARKMAALYKNDTSLIDLFVGGMAETIDGPGELFTAIILDQFARIRDGDRFWFENSANGLFTPSEIGQLRSLRMKTLLERHIGTNHPQVTFGASPWFVSPTDTCQPPLDIGSLSLENCTALAIHDYWTDASSSALPGTAMLFVGFFISCLLGVWATLGYERRRRAKLMKSIDESFNAPLKSFDSTVIPPPSVSCFDDFIHLPSSSSTIVNPSPYPLASPPPVTKLRGSALTTVDETVASGSSDSSQPPRVPSAHDPSASPSVSPEQFQPSLYGAVLYAPSMGTASVYAEIVEHSVDPTAPLVSNPTGSRIESGSSVGWLSIRGAAEMDSGQHLYHVPLSFIHTVVVFGSKHSHQSADHVLSSPVSVNNRIFSRSAMTRLNDELRSNGEFETHAQANYIGSPLHSPVNVAMSPTHNGHTNHPLVTPRAVQDDPLEPLRRRSIKLMVPKRYDV